MNPYKQHTLLATAALFLLSCVACAPSRFVKPLDKNQQAVGLSLGGPVISTDNLTVPLPFVTAMYAYGIDSSLTGFGSINITSALYGNIQAELGITKTIFRPKRFVPGLSISPVANFIYRPGDRFKLYPQVDVNAYWDFNRNRNYIYVGVCNWFELAKKKASGVTQENRWLASPMLGQVFARKKWELAIEAKFLAVNLPNNYSTVTYKTPLGTNGAFGIYIHYTRKF